MSRLLALSFDAPASPRITLKGPETPLVEHTQSFGWGIAWYPPEEKGAVVVKDPSPHGDDHMSRQLNDWSRFRSTSFVCHLRGAARRVAQQDTHPFARNYAGKAFVLTHNGTLRRGWAESLPLGSAPAWEPLGKTDTEHVLCWLLGRLRETGVRRLVDLGWPTLRDWLTEVNALGPANLLLSDGTDVVAYQDQANFNPMYYFRRRPPQDTFVLENDEIELDISDARDRSRTFIMVATSPLGQDWQIMQPGQMLVLRRGAIVWNSAAPNEARLHRQAPPAPDLAAGEPRRAQISVQQASAAPLLALEPNSLSSGHMPDPNLIEYPASNETRTLRIAHTTIYRYEAPIERSFHLLRLRPVHDRHQEVLEHRIEISPGGIQQKFDDVFGNEVVRLDIEMPYTELRLSTESLVRLIPDPSRTVNTSAGRSSIPLVWMPWQRQMMMPYLLPHELPETQLRELFDYAMSFVERQDYDLTETLLDINATINRDYAYIQGVTTIETTPFEVYTSRRGVCQDFANLLICLARLLGVPARYRAGYIHTGTDYENKVQSDATHAWAELYLPWYGWYGFDPTNGCVANQDHVRVACGRNYRDATPTSGTIFRGGGAEALTIEVRVELAN